MAQKTNSIERFWKELKRRKVVHVITVYAAVAFVIMQVVDMVAEPLKLPDSTKALVIVLLCIGFIIAVFLSWVYDITPAGVKKTKPVSAAKHIDQTTTPTSSGWKIAAYISGIIIIALLAFNFINRRNLNSDILKLDKSIAVLPFLNESPVDSNKYFINGIMEEVLTNLQKIKDFRILSRTSTDQYIGTNRPTMPEIAKKLGVSYIVEGSGQKYGNMFRLRVQLIKGKGKENHLWAKSYEQELKETTGLFNIQSQIAQAIVAELKATITPEEKKLIEKVPTTNLTAYDLYLKANNYLKEYEKTSDSSFYQNAIIFYKTAHVIDPNYAKAYTGLARAYYDRYQWETYFKEKYMDSMLVLAKTALSIDDQLDEAYYIEGRYYQINGNSPKALDIYDKALKINPNFYPAYEGKGDIFTSTVPDYVKGIDNYHRALNLISGNESLSSLRSLGYAYLNVGLIEKAKNCFQDAFALNGDSVEYFSDIGWLELCLENFQEALNLDKRCLKIDSTYLPNVLIYSFLGHDEEAYLYTLKHIRYIKKSGVLYLNNSHRGGYAFYQVGKMKEAKYWFNQQIKYGEGILKLGRELAQSKAAYYDLAGTYAFLGNKLKAYQYLDEFNKKNVYDLTMISLAKHDPLFNSISNEERFQKILQNVEAKYQAEHERVKKWLEKQGML
jgi:TolB-like protein